MYAVLRQRPITGGTEQRFFIEVNHSKRGATMGSSVCQNNDSQIEPHSASPMPARNGYFRSHWNSAPWAVFAFQWHGMLIA